MLMPKRVKRRRVHRGSMAGKAQKGNKVTYGEFGLVAMEASWITSNQIEAARIAMTRSIKRGGKVWIKIFPHKPVTRKPAETRMGAGKGSPELMSKLNDFKSELFSLRFQLATGQLENTARIKFVKKDIARVKTVLAERKLNETRA